MNKKRGVNKKGQTQISFGVIFSVILIIVFIAFAIFGIGKIMQMNNLIKVKNFEKKLQENIDTIWKDSGSNEFTYYLPNKIKQVCFIEDDLENMYFEPIGEYDGFKLKNVDIEASISQSISIPKKLCIDNVNGKLSLILKRDYGQTLVTITK